jgi:hypothetical protein
LAVFPTLAPPPVQDHLDSRVPGEILLEKAPNVRLISRHNEQASNPVSCRLDFKRSTFDWHSCLPRTLDLESVRELYADGQGLSRGRFPENTTIAEGDPDARAARGV